MCGRKLLQKPNGAETRSIGSTIDNTVLEPIGNGGYYAYADTYYSSCNFLELVMLAYSL